MSHKLLIARSVDVSSSKSAYPRTLTKESLAKVAGLLASRDRNLRAIYDLYGPPPMWGRRPGFATLLRIVLEQQVSLISARAMYERLRLNLAPFEADTFIDRGEEYLRSLGMTRQKAHYAVQVAQAFRKGDLNFIGKLSDEDAHAMLTRIKGVGPWTANIYLLMALRRPDIWPDGDIALATAFGKLHKLKARPTFPELAQNARRWQPYRSVAARMLWQYYLAEQNRL